MLAKEERERLLHLQRTLKVQENIPVEVRPPYYFDLEQSLWLVSALLKTDRECHESDSELAKYKEMYERADAEITRINIRHNWPRYS